MQFRNLSLKMLAAAHAHVRPRFATQVALALISFADENGLVRATRQEIAALVDRSDFNLKKKSIGRRQKISADYRTLEIMISKANNAYLAGTISQAQLEVLIERLNREFFKAVRSPALANVSNVISHFAQHGLVEIKYRDKGGALHETIARGRFAQYILIDRSESHDDYASERDARKKDSDYLTSIRDLAQDDSD